MNSFEQERELRKQQVAQGYRIFASYGWGDDGSGHISGRDPVHTDCFWLLGYDISFAAATPDDLVLVGPDGQVREGNGDINPAAFCIHAPIHEARPDVIGACHTQTAYGTPFAALMQPITATSQEACAFHNDQALFDGEELDVRNLQVGGRLAAALGPHRLVIMANHGLLTVGQTVAQSVGFFVLAERAAEVQIKAPTGRVISAGAAASVYESVGPADNGDSIFSWLVRSRLDR